MTRELFEACQQWVADGTSHRSIKVELGDPGSREHETIFAYDYTIGDGTLVNSVEQLVSLDLRQKKRLYLKEQLASLETSMGIQQFDMAA